MDCSNWRRPGPISVRPVLLFSLSGFVDAGSTGRLLSEHLIETLDHEVVATFDVDQLLDYRGRRPAMTFSKDHWSEYADPSLILYALRDQSGQEFLLLQGPEPDWQWERFCEAVRMLVERLGVRLAVSFHGIPMAVPHTRPLGVTAHATDPTLIAGNEAWMGEVLVPGSASALLEFRLGEWGHPALGYAVHVPHYLSQADFHDAALVALRAISAVSGLSLPDAALEDAAERTRADIVREVGDSEEVGRVVDGAGAAVRRVPRGSLAGQPAGGRDHRAAERRRAGRGLRAVPGRADRRGAHAAPLSRPGGGAASGWKTRRMDVLPTFSPAPDRYDSMTYRRSGRSGLQLPAVSLGFWHNFGDDMPLERQRAIVRRAIDLGITHLDLANNYGPPYGAAERNFGILMQQDLRPLRDELVISSKAGYDMWPGPYGEWGSRKYLLASLDQSLGRMGLDYVDIFYSHRFDPETPLEETMGALASAVHSGKALYAGISSYSPEKTREAAALLAGHGRAAADPPAVVLDAQPLGRGRPARRAGGRGRGLHRLLAVGPGHADRSLPGRHPGRFPCSAREVAVSGPAHRRGDGPHPPAQRDRG